MGQSDAILVHQVGNPLIHVHTLELREQRAKQGWCTIAVSRLPSQYIADLTRQIARRVVSVGTIESKEDYGCYNVYVQRKKTEDPLRTQTSNSL